MRILLFTLGVCCITASGCTVVGCNRVFPKLDWYWSKDAKECRREQRQSNAWRNPPWTNGVVGETR